jgi:hypothetical protein
MGSLSPFKECCNIKQIKQAWKGVERESNASSNLNFEVIWCYRSHQNEAVAQENDELNPPAKKTRNEMGCAQLTGYLPATTVCK